MSGTPRLSSADHAALRSIASGGANIDAGSRHWLSFYRLIDETRAGWCVTARGHDYLRRLAAQPVTPSPEPWFLKVSSPVGETYR